MALRFYLDASVLAKRYVAEAGTPVVNHLFARVPRDRLICLGLGTLEVISIFVRRRNAHRIAAAAFRQAMTDFRNEVLDSAQVAKIPIGDAEVNAAMPLVSKHSLNATDAVIVRSGLDLAVSLRGSGHDLVLVASDQRLLRAAQAEGLLTFNPETQDQPALDAPLGP